MILNGSFSGRRYRVEGTAPQFGAEQNKALSRHTFVPIDPASDKMRVGGWVDPRRILDDEINVENLIFGPHIVLGMRIDTRKVNRSLLKARVERALRVRLREEPGKRIGREERTTITKAIEAEMLAKTEPRTNIQQIWWNTATGTLWFTSTSKILTEDMMELFEKTFDLKLVPLLPYTMAERHTETTGKGGGALERSVPTDFRPH